MSYSFAGLLAIIIHLVINVRIFSKRTGALLPEERNYRAFLYSVIAYYITDALWGVLYEQGLSLLVFIDTEIYFFVMAISVLLWIKYVLCYLRDKSLFGKILTYIGNALFVFQVIAITANLFYPILFYFDKNGEYHAEPIRYIAFIIQILMYIMISIYTFYISSKIDKQIKNRYRTIGAFGLSMIFSIALQIIYPLLPMYSVGYLLGCCVLHIFVLEEEKNEYRLTHDVLTGLPNSKFLISKIQGILNASNKEDISLGVIYIGLDNFKSINDFYGYQKGDEILCSISQRLRDLIYEASLARANADNFLAVIRAKNKDMVTAQASYILSSLNEPFVIHSHKVYIGASVGLAFLSADCDDGRTLVHHAELAMFDAKRRGGNAISIFTESMRTSAFEKKQLEGELYKAVENGSFTLNYQPKVDISKNDVSGCEALVRWQTKEGKWISPAAFIPIAEKTGLVTRIDMFALRTACRQVLVWDKDGTGAVPIAVNMSVQSILSEGFADQVISILEEEGTPTSLIDVEITETSFMSDMDTAFSAISRLHEAGIHIALDDFGTGYSSLQYLSAMPISFLKIDRKFVDDIFSGKVTAQPLVKSIIALADSLGMETICEGVEDKNQLAFLAGNGAHIIQGYLFSKPLSTIDCGEYLRNRKAHIASVMQAV